MPKAPRVARVDLASLLRHRFPEVDDPVQLILAGFVLVDNAPVLNPRSSVRSDASVRLVGERPLRGTLKLSSALRAFGINVCGAVALDLGAAAGGFTQALLDAGAKRVYAVDVGVGQLLGTLRNDPRVINLERTNLAELNEQLVPETADVVTLDLSYLALADAVPQIKGSLLTSCAQLVALVKPTFELRSGLLASSPEDVARALTRVRHALQLSGWRVVADVPSMVRGSGGAVEAFVHAVRLS